MRLASKFILILSSATLVLLAAYAYVAYQHEVAVFDERFEREIVLVGHALRDVVETAWMREGQQRALQVIEAANQTQAEIQVRWVWLQLPTPREVAPLAAPELWKQIRQFGESTLELEDSSGQFYQVTYLCLELDDGPASALEIARPLTHRDASRRDGMLRLLQFGGAALLLSGVLLLVLGDVFVGRPLKLLLEQTRRIGRGEWSKPLDLQRSDEFGELAIAINTMSQQLESAQQRVDREHTARLATLEQLRHADRLRTVGRLAAGIAHELGTPLNVVSGRAGLIASGQLDEGEVQNSALAIKKEVDRITRTVRELLDFARRTTPQKSPTDLSELVRETLQIVSPLAQKQRCELQADCDGPLIAEADKGQLQQVLSNLLINALQAVGENGIIRVQIAQMRATPPADLGKAEGEYVQINVADNGPGIPDDVLPHVFEPFFTTKDVGEGTGLGLSIAYGIVHEHGGWIQVDSRPGEGTCFSIFLPAEEPACQEAS